MLNYIEYLTQNANMSAYISGGIVVIFVVSQVIGELLELKGKVVPEFIKVRKYFARKRQERETAKETVETLKDVQTLLADVKQHYNEDNIAMRDKWMKTVNEGLNENKTHWQELNKAMLSLLIDSKRSTIITFASRVIEPSCLVTREEFNRVFKLYEEYEGIIRDNGMTNGEVDIAIRIIRESYEERLKSRSFLEDIRGYSGQ